MSLNLCCLAEILKQCQNESNLAIFMSSYLQSLSQKYCFISQIQRYKNMYVVFLCVNYKLGCLSLRLTNCRL